MAKLEWGFSHKPSGPEWPKGDDGVPVSPVYLTHLSSTDMEGAIVISLLESNGIPVVTQYPNNGMFGRVILGMSGTGVDLYVPEPMLEDARELTRGDFEEEEIDDVQS